MLKSELQKQLPKVGDIRLETMTISDRWDTVRPEKCTVVEVRPDRLWYRVRFHRTGTCECYKLPISERMAGCAAERHTVQIAWNERMRCARERSDYGQEETNQHIR